MIRAYPPMFTLVAIPLGIIPRCATSARNHLAPVQLSFVYAEQKAIQNSRHVATAAVRTLWPRVLGRVWCGRIGAHLQG